MQNKKLQNFCMSESPPETTKSNSSLQDLCTFEKFSLSPSRKMSTWENHMPLSITCFGDWKSQKERNLRWVHNHSSSIFYHDNLSQNGTSQLEVEKKMETYDVNFSYLFFDKLENEIDSLIEKILLCSTDIWNQWRISLIKLWLGQQEAYI